MIPIPALKNQSKYYPTRFEGKVPKKVKMLTTVSSDIGFFKPEKIKFGYEGEIYDAWTNSHGAVAIETPDGLLGVKPDEFEIVEWY